MCVRARSLRMIERARVCVGVLVRTPARARECVRDSAPQRHLLCRLRARACSAGTMERGASCSSSSSDSPAAALDAPTMNNFADKDGSPVVRFVCMRVGALAMKSFADQVGAPAVNNFANKAVTLATKCFAGKVGALAVNNFANDLGTLACSSFADKVGTTEVNNFADRVGALAAASFLDCSGAPAVNNFGDGEASCVGDQEAGAEDAAVAIIEKDHGTPAVNNFADEIGELVPRVAQ